MADTLRIKLDFDNTTTADDGDTSHYGGEYSVEKIQAKWPDFKDFQSKAEDEDSIIAQTYIDHKGPAPTYKWLDISNDVVVEVTNKRTMRATLTVTRTKDGTFSAKLGPFRK